MRIYWEDTDAAGIVFYANYLKFFERARTEWLRSLGFGQERAARRDRRDAFVVSRDHAALPAPGAPRRRDRRQRRRRSTSARRSLEIAQQARRADELLAEGTIRIGCVELGTFRPRRIPNDISPRSAPSMNQDLSIVTLVLHASLVVQIVMAGLMIASLASWTVIFGKLFGLRRTCAPRNDEFEREFWAGRNLNDLYADADQAGRRRADGAHLRLAACASSSSCARSASPTPAPCSTARAGRCGRASSASSTRSSRTCRSSPRSARCRPYVGLFGTVWGIMHAFIGLSNMQQVTLATVAPGHRRGAGRHRDRPVRGDPGGDRLQPLRARHRPHRRPARELHRGVLQHPAAQRRRDAGAGAAPPTVTATPMPAVLAAARAGARSARSTWSRSSTSCWCC